MQKRLVGLWIVLMAAAIAPMGLSQMAQTPMRYTYVSQFQMPRANWTQFAEDQEKNGAAILDKLMANGTIVSYGNFENVVHSSDGFTHGTWWSSDNIAGLMKVLDEFRKTGPRPAQIASTKHEDFLLRNVLGRSKSVSAGSGYLRVVCHMTHPNKGDDYVAGLNKYLRPTFDEQLDKGMITSYSVDEQYVNTEAPSLRCVVFTYPNAESIDKWAGTIDGVLGKMSAADREAFFGTTVPDSRRDFMARITRYANK